MSLDGQVESHRFSLDVILHLQGEDEDLLIYAHFKTRFEYSVTRAIIRDTVVITNIVCEENASSYLDKGQCV